MSLMNSILKPAAGVALFSLVPACVATDAEPTQQSEAPVTELEVTDCEQQVGADYASVCEPGGYSAAEYDAGIPVLLGLALRTIGLRVGTRMAGSAAAAILGFIKSTMSSAYALNRVHTLYLNTINGITVRVNIYMDKYGYYKWAKVTINGTTYDLDDVVGYFDDITDILLDLAGEEDARVEYGGGSGGPSDSCDSPCWEGQTVSDYECLFMCGGALDSYANKCYVCS